jgi:hypothetical protein
MPNQPWWQPVAQHAVWLLVMSAVMAWMAKSRLQPRGKVPAGEMVYPASMLIIALVCVVVFAAITVLSWVYPAPNFAVFVTLFFAGFTLLGVPLVVEYFRVRFRLELDGLRYQTLFGRRGVLPWSQVTAIRFSPTAKWFRLAGQQGEVIRVSAMMIRLPEFAEVLLQRAGHAKIDAMSREVLEATAAGNPPSMWG